MVGEKPTIDSSIYREYKYCTDEVLQWGLKTWKSKFGKKKRRNRKTTLSIKFDKLRQLAEAGVRMPEPVHKKLGTALKLREKASKFYERVPSSNEANLDGHKWVIEQLRVFFTLFSHDGAVDRAHETLHAEFSATLALCDDDDDDDESEANKDKTEENIILKQPFKRIPTPEEVAEEDRCFAIACMLADISDIRSDIQGYWKRWATTDEWTDDDFVAVGELVGTSVFFSYAVHMVHTLVLQTSLEHDAMDDLERILQPGDEDFESETQDLTSIDDNMLSSLKKIYAILKGFDIASIPQEMYDIKFYDFGEEAKEHKRTVLQGPLKRIIECQDEIRDACRCGNVSAFTTLLVRNYFPVWIAYARGKEGRSPDPLMAYLLKFQETGTIQLHFVFLLLMLADSAFEQEKGNRGVADFVKELIDRVLKEYCDEEIYTALSESFEYDTPITAKLHEVQEFITLWSPCPLLGWFASHLAPRDTFVCIDVFHYDVERRNPLPSPSLSDASIGRLSGKR